ncbi:hypothetical protein AC1031_004199 [Aphanomyces cochlioides]|nr:hypothetical protein AC1031_004199 [Aphanomyces cochlioides]
MEDTSVFSDGTLPEGQFFNNDGTIYKVDLRANREELSELIYEEDDGSASVVDSAFNIAAVARSTTRPILDDAPTFTVRDTPDISLHPGVRPPSYSSVLPNLAGPATIAFANISAQDQSRHQNYHIHYNDESSELRYERIMREEQLRTQTAELARQTVKSEAMQQAGIALEQELEAARGDREAHEARARHSEDLVKAAQAQSNAMYQAGAALEQQVKATQMAKEAEEKRARHAEETARTAQFSHQKAQEGYEMMLDVVRRLELQIEELRHCEATWGAIDAARHEALKRERESHAGYVKPEIGANRGASLPPQPPNSWSSGLGNNQPPRANSTLLSGFAAPKPPRYTGYSLPERKAFARAYFEYCNEFAEAATQLGTRIGIRPIGTCIEAKAKDFAITFHLRKSPESVTNNDLYAYFQAALDHRPINPSELIQKLSRTVIMNESELDEDLVFDKWVHDYSMFLEKHNLRGYRNKHPKPLVKALIEGIRPDDLRQQIKSSLELENKHMRNSVMMFFDFVKVALGHQRQLMRAKKLHVALKSTEAETPNRRQARALKAAPAAANAGSPAAVVAKVNKIVCWGCGGPHNMRVCEVTSEAERKSIRERKAAERKPTKNVKSLRWPSSAPADGSCWATVPDSGLDKPFLALMDSGSDAPTILSHGLFDALNQSQLSRMQSFKLPRSQIMHGFGNVPLSLDTHVVVPELVLRVGGASITLRNVSAWVDPTDTAVGVTIGRPIMKALGYSTEALLIDAARLLEVIDLSDISVLDNEDG